MSEINHPHAEYTTRAGAFQKSATRLARLHAVFANLRLLVFVSGLVLAWIILRTEDLSPGWLIPALVFFVVLLIAHDRVLKSKSRAVAMVAYYQCGLARLNGQWVGRGEAGEHLVPGGHIYAKDLDLFGTGSLYELLCTARTQTGQHTLAQWLCTPVSAAEIRSRQEAVQELAPNLEVREDLAITGESIQQQIDLSFLHDWAAQPSPISAGIMRLGSVFLLLVTVCGAGLSLAGGHPLPALTAFIVALVFSMAHWKKLLQCTRSIQHPLKELLLMRGVLRLLENTPFQSPRVRAIQNSLNQNRGSASKKIALLDKIRYYDESLNLNPAVFLVIAIVFLLKLYVLFSVIACGRMLIQFHLAARVERWRREWGSEIETWVRAAGEFETLSSLATYAYEHPEAPYPVIEAEGRCLEARALGHPLLPRDVCVSNDITLGGLTKLIIVSGSNMSGKTTFLKSIGVNIVMAHLGLPVCAREMRLAPFHIGAAIGAQGSIQSGMSQFYAEIDRIKHILDTTTGPYPVVFLLDELLHGTNSHDRHIGAKAIVKALVEKNAIGLITTHDLALTHIADSLKEQARNVHFACEVVDGTLRYDYRMRPGVIQQGNAIALMRSLGIAIETEKVANFLR